MRVVLVALLVCISLTWANNQQYSCNNGSATNSSSSASLPLTALNTTISFNGSTNAATTAPSQFNINPSSDYHMATVSLAGTQTTAIGENQPLCAYFIFSPYYLDSITNKNYLADLIYYSNYSSFSYTAPNSSSLQAASISVVMPGSVSSMNVYFMTNYTVTITGGMTLCYASTTTGCSSNCTQTNPVFTTASYTNLQAGSTTAFIPVVGCVNTNTDIYA